MLMFPIHWTHPTYACRSSQGSCSTAGRG